MTCIKCSAALPPEAVFCHLCGKRQAPEPPRYRKRANGTGSVSKAAEPRTKPWKARKNNTLIGYYATRTEALKALAALDNKPMSDSYNMTVSEVYAEWSREHFRDLSERGESMHGESYVRIQALHNKRFRSLTLRDMQDVIDDLDSKGRSRSTTEKTKSLLNLLYKWAIREGIVETNTAQYIKLQKEEKKEKPVFTDEHIKSLDAAAKAGSETAMLILILIKTGMRIGELFSMAKGSVHMVERYMVGGSKTEAGTNRIIPIPDSIVEYVQYFYDKATALLIDGYTGNKTIKNFGRRDFADELARLGIVSAGKLTPHSTRHTFASLAVKAGVKPEYLQKVIGHADYNTTANIYTHADKDSLIDAVRGL